MLNVLQGKRNGERISFSPIDYVSGVSYVPQGIWVGTMAKNKNYFGAFCIQKKLPLVNTILLNVVKCSK